MRRGRHPRHGRMCACQKRGQPDLKQMKCKLNRPRRETAEIRSTGPGLRVSKLVRTWAATRYSCGVRFPRRFLFSPARSKERPVEMESAVAHGSGDVSREKFSNERERGLVFSRPGKGRGRRIEYRESLDLVLFGKAMIR